MSWYLLSNEASEARKGMLETRSDRVKSPSWGLIKSCMIAGRSQALKEMLVLGALSLAGKLPCRRERVHCPRHKRLRRFICGGRGGVQCAWMQLSSLCRARGATHTFAFFAKNEDGPHMGCRYDCCAYLTSSCDAQVGQPKVLVIGQK